MWNVLRAFRIGLFSAFFYSRCLFAADICASKYEDLTLTPRLLGIQKLFNESRHLGMVNETEGSYFSIEALSDKLVITFYTSGLFDLYAVRREGPLVFCDTGSGLRLIGIDRVEEVNIASATQLKIGEGGPRLSFHVGVMPTALGVLHHVVERGLASGP